ncbi:MAG: 3'(2'),5'-bisphosphate nucleotidase CysQ [Pseudomonadota bacterium]
MPATDLPLLIDAARAAGKVATRFSGKTARRWDKPDDAGPVTEADLAVNDLLAKTLLGERPAYGWLSEETDDGEERLSKDRVFIIDPIDGTRSFVEGARTWAHSIAVTERGRVTAAVVFLPMHDRLYAAALGQGATLNGQSLSASETATPGEMEVLAAKPAFKAQHWRGGAVPDVKRGYRPSLAYRLALVAEGRFDAMLTLRPTWEWDIAAGSLIVTEAGGAATTRDGAALVFNNPDPRVDGILAGGMPSHAHLRATLA